MSIIKVKPQTPSVSTVANTVANAVHSFEERLPTSEEYGKIPTGSLIVVHSKDDAVSGLPGMRAVTESYYKVEPEPVSEDFAFVIYGSRCEVGFLSGEELNFTIDWGDGTENVVNSTAISQRTHEYENEQEWTITIKDYVSGWIDFIFTSYTGVRRVLTPFPKSTTRTSFRNCFYGGNGSFLTSIPENLFAKNLNATDFRGCFMYCSDLEFIPEKLFVDNTAAVDFSGCFAGCMGLNSIPENLFKNNLNAVNFSYCFHGCRNLSNIDINLHQDVLSRDTNYNGMFETESMFSHIGNAPELWNSATTTTEYKEACFRNNYDLENYYDIPAEWK